MISLLTGTVHTLLPDSFILYTASGVGYRIYVPLRMMERLQVEQEMTVYTHQYIRDDAVQLYGFESASDLLLFERLIHVSSVGPRIALALLSQLGADQVRTAIMNSDTAVLSGVHGVGKKTAQRIIIELREPFLRAAPSSVHTPAAHASVGAIDALLSLGYTPQEARDALHGVDTSLSIEEQVRQALKHIASHS